ncbi:MAG TPA: plastocyanin/azurin family copper-binding protein [Solirubrobacteraceae bacterium]|jgi:plastocyanin
MRLRSSARALTAAALCVALCAIAGCGSSSDSNSNDSGGAAISTGNSANSSGTSSTASSSGATTKSKTKPPASGGLKYNTTPKYATPSSSAPVQSGVVQVAYRNIAIDPDTLRVKAGSTVRWTNYDPVEHNVTSKGGPDHFASKTFAEGGTVEFKLTKPGIVHYVCTIHPTTMNGTIEVVK